MIPRSCGECGGPVETSTASIEMELRGETVLVDDVEHGRCAHCGEVYLDLSATARLQRAAVHQLRASRGLLTPDEIRALRRDLGVSQAGLERLLGVGSKTVVRWEKGTVFQGATADRLMRLLALKPELVESLKDADMRAPLVARPRESGPGPAS